MMRLCLYLSFAMRSFMTQIDSLVEAILSLVRASRKAQCCQIHRWNCPMGPKSEPWMTLVSALSSPSLVKFLQTKRLLRRTRRLKTWAWSLCRLLILNNHRSRNEPFTKDPLARQLRQILSSLFFRTQVRKASICFNTKTWRRHWKKLTVACQSCQKRLKLTSKRTKNSQEQRT